MQKAIIELKNITKKFKKTYAIDKVSFKILEGEITGIIGPNGAGKTTLLKIISGFIHPDKGSIHFYSKKVQSFRAIKNYIFFIEEDTKLYPEYYVKEFLDFYHSIINNFNDNLIKRFSIEKNFTKKIKNLSRGWHQRLKLYISLSSEKPIIIFDEPFSGLDPIQVREFSKILKEEKKKGKSFILSIHELSYAEKICDRFILLEEGKIVSYGSLKELQELYSLQTNSLEEIYIRALS